MQKCYFCLDGVSLPHHWSPQKDPKKPHQTGVPPVTWGFFLLAGKSPATARDWGVKFSSVGASGQSPNADAVVTMLQDGTVTVGLHGICNLPLGPIRANALGPGQTSESPKYPSFREAGRKESPANRCAGLFLCRNNGPARPVDACAHWIPPLIQRAYTLSLTPQTGRKTTIALPRLLGSLVGIRKWRLP
jgi:hypothetical protein